MLPDDCILSTNIYDLGFTSDAQRFLALTTDSRYRLLQCSVMGASMEFSMVSTINAELCQSVPSGMQVVIGFMKSGPGDFKFCEGSSSVMHLTRSAASALGTLLVSPLVFSPRRFVADSSEDGPRIYDVASGTLCWDLAVSSDLAEVEHEQVLELLKTSWAVSWLRSGRGLAYLSNNGMSGLLHAVTLHVLTFV